MTHDVIVVLAVLGVVGQVVFGVLLVAVLLAAAGYDGPLETIRAFQSDYRMARYLLPLPLVGAGIAVYHLLVENGVVKQSQGCLASAPGGCETKWINKFGHMTIPTLALCFACLALAASEPGRRR